MMSMWVFVSQFWNQKPELKVRLHRFVSPSFMKKRVAADSMHVKSMALIEKANADALKDAC